MSTDLKPLLIGLAPAHARLGPVFGGPCDRFLTKLCMGANWRRHCTAVNLLPKTIETYGLARRTAERNNARALARGIAPFSAETTFYGLQRPVVFFGRDTAEAFGIYGGAWYTRAQCRITEAGNKKCWLFPHPSGLCRVWNDPATVQHAGQLLRELLGISVMTPVSGAALSGEAVTG